MAKKTKVVVLLSGGLDSTVMLYQCAKQCKVAATVSFNYGSKHNKRELPLAAYHSRYLGIHNECIDLRFVNDLFRSELLLSGGRIPDGHYNSQAMKKTVVPFRNGIFLSIAAGYAESLGATAVVLGAHTGDHTIYPDCRLAFVEAMAKAVGLGTYANIQILSPLIGLSKTEIVSLGRRLNVDFAKTWSCYKGFSKQCGTCGTCTERREAFKDSKTEDPTEYRSFVARRNIRH